MHTHNHRAAAYTKLNMYEEAIRDCEKGVALDPTYSKAYSRLGTCYFSKHRYADALDAYKYGAHMRWFRPHAWAALFTVARANSALRCLVY